MIFGIIILFSVDLVQGQVPWWDLPYFYLTNQFVEPDLIRALAFANTHDPQFTMNYLATVLGCYARAARPTPPLNIHQEAAIFCYTSDTQIPRRINQALRSWDVELLVAWSPYLKFFHPGIGSLPAVPIAQFCRGDPYYFPVREPGSYYVLPLSISTDIQTCRRLSGDPPQPCTITKLISPEAKSIDDFSYFPEAEYIVLPGVLGRLIAEIPESTTECRTLILFTVSAALVPIQTLVTSLIPPYPLGPHTTNVTNLFNDNLNSTEMGQWDRFSKKFYKPKDLVRVDKTKHLSISTTGGYDGPDNSWPHISNITSDPIDSSINLRVGQILVAVNGYSTYGMLHDEVEQLIMNAKMDQTNYTDYTVADP